MLAESRILEIDLGIITRNARQVVQRCAEYGIGICGVTKATCGSPMVARAMLKGGVNMIGESRIDNAKRLRYGGVQAPMMMLRIPAPSEADEIVRLFDSSLNSESKTLSALSLAAEIQAKQHDVILMLEMGDRREGVLEEDLLPLCLLVQELPGLRLAGIGANFMCVSGILPTPDKINKVAVAALRVQDALGITLPYVSAGNSANLAWIDSATPSIINQLRVGASILRGENPITGGSFDWLEAGAFRLQAELIEIQRKDSLPDGQVGRDAFGGEPAFEDDGLQLRGLVNLGRIDIRHEGLTPEAEGVEVVAASSDHLVLDLNQNYHFEVGDKLAFSLDYGALTQAMLSPYVTKVLVNREYLSPEPTEVRVEAEAALLRHPAFHGFRQELDALGYSMSESSRAFPLSIAASRAFEPELDDLECGVLCLDSEPGDLLHFNAESTALFALQRANSQQAELISERSLLSITMEDIDLRGAQDCIRSALRQVTNGTDGFALILHVSVGGGMVSDPEQMGLSYRECSLVMERIAATQQLRAVALSGLSVDSSNIQLQRAFAHVLTALGKKIL